MTDFDMFEPDHGYGKRPPSPPSEDAINRRAFIQSELARGKITDDAPSGELERHEDRGRPLSPYEPCGFFMGHYGDNVPVRFSVARHREHPRLERIQGTGDDPLYLVDGRMCASREDAEKRVVEVERDGTYHFGSATLREVRAGALQWCSPPATNISTGDERID